MGNAARHDGFLACGAPFDATLDDLSFDFDGMSVITPIGSERFVKTFLEAFACSEAATSISIHAPPGEPGI